MLRQFLVFLARWALNAFGLWVAFRLLGTGYENVDVTAGTVGFLVAGLIFSVVNTIVKPLIVILSLPAILLTLGLFTLIVNGFLVYISILIAPGLEMSFVHSILTGIILSLINYIVSATLDIWHQTRKPQGEEE